MGQVKPLHAPMLTYCQLEPKDSNQNVVNFTDDMAHQTTNNFAKLFRNFDILEMTRFSIIFVSRYTHSRCYPYIICLESIGMLLEQIC